MKKSYKCELETLEARSLMSSSPLGVAALKTLPQPSSDHAVVAIASPANKASVGVETRAIIAILQPKPTFRVPPTRMAGPQPEPPVSPPTRHIELLVREVGTRSIDLAFAPDRIELLV